MNTGIKKSREASVPRRTQKKSLVSDCLSGCAFWSVFQGIPDKIGILLVRLLLTYGGGATVDEDCELVGCKFVFTEVWGGLFVPQVPGGGS